MTPCPRRPYPTEEAAREAAAVEAIRTAVLRPTFKCSWCYQWHIGQDPGRVIECANCSMLIGVARGRAPVEQDRGWIHTKRRCKEATRAAGRKWIDPAKAMVA